MGLARTVLAGLLLAAPAVGAPEVPAGAFGAGADDGGDPAVEASLLVDASAAQPGEPLRLGVLFELDRGWHIYWRNPGGSGLPTVLNWTAAGAEVGPMRWPAPYVFREDDGETTAYGYSRSVLLHHEARVTATAGEKLELAVDADFVVCKVLCVPGRISLERSVPVEARSRPAESATRALFEEWGRRVPLAVEAHRLTVDAHYSQSAIRPGDAFLAAISLVCEGSEGCGGLRPGTDRSRESFVPDATPGILLEATGSRTHPFADGVLLTLAGTALSEEPESNEQRLRGVAQLRNALGDWLAVEIDLPLPRAASGAEIAALENPWLEPEAERSAAGVALGRAVLLALLGGLILNLMPCVLPVLAIKVFGIAERAHANRRDVMLHGAAYTAGILATMGVLAAVVIALRAAGTAVGWGFQFQEPVFVAAISALLVVFAMNLFEVFEIATPGASRLAVGAGASGARRSFFEGLLAVLLATPCSAPFLGTAVGFAFASSAPVIVGIFLAVGLGLALPFVAITFVPGLARLLPRSGPWMTHLRAGLGFALLGTVVWLLWVVGRSVGTDGIALVLGFLVALGIGVWIYGARQRANPDGRARVAGLVVAAATVAALAWIPLEPVEAPDPAATGTDSARGSANSLGASPFAPAAIEAELAGGRPVFVYFTADWCLTCKVNESIVLHDPRVASELSRLDVAAFEANWTRRDETIRAELARFGRAGVPMYLLYDPRAPDRPELLPELLTVDVVLEALHAVGG